MSTHGKNGKGKTVLITGGAKGIGRETARLFGRDGWNLVISGRDAVALQTTALKFRGEGFEVLEVQADVANTNDCRRLVESAVESYGRLDVLINNAGMSMRGNFAETSLELFDKVIDINFTGAVHMSSYALPHLIASAGSAVFVSSLSALKGFPGIAPYGAAKMALTGFTESLYAELHKKIHIGVLYVSFTENDPEKHMYSADGNLVELHRDRNSSTQLDVARAVKRMVEKKQRRVVMTPLGKIAALFFALFPRGSELLISRFAAKSNLYGEEEGGGKER